MAWILILATTLCISCSAPEKLSSDKLDAPLRQKLVQMEEADSREPVLFIGKTREPLNAEMRVSLAAIGINVQSVIGDIFTASGAAPEIRAAAGLDFVLQLQLSVERQPKP